MNANVTFGWKAIEELMFGKILWIDLSKKIFVKTVLLNLNKTITVSEVIYDDFEVGDFFQK